MSNVKAIRDRAWHFLNPDVAAFAGMTLAQLQQFAAGGHMPTETQLAALAARIGVEHDR